MVEFPLDRDLNSYLSCFEEVYKKVKIKSEPKLLQKFGLAQPIFELINQGLNRRKEIYKFARSIIDIRKGKDDIILIWDEKYIFEEIRFIALSSLLASCCGIYDNINYICRNLLIENWKITDKKVITSSILEFADLKPHKDDIEKMKDKYGFPLALLYYIRHNIFHRKEFIGGRIDGFKTKYISDGYSCVKNRIIELKDACCKDYKVEITLCSNDGLLNIMNSDEICFLSLLELLMNDIDLCIGEFINYSINTHK